MIYKQFFWPFSLFPVASLYGSIFETRVTRHRWFDGYFDPCMIRRFNSRMSGFRTQNQPVQIRDWLSYDYRLKALSCPLYSYRDKSSSMMKCSTVSNISRWPSQCRMYTIPIVDRHFVCKLTGSSFVVQCLVHQFYIPLHFILHCGIFGESCIITTGRFLFFRTTISPNVTVHNWRQVVIPGSREKNSN